MAFVSKSGYSLVVDFASRFLGFKGVLVVDYRLTGIRMRLRPSMKKFDVDEEEKNNASLEIVRASDRPNRYSLNRSESFSQFHSPTH